MLEPRKMLSTFARGALCAVAIMASACDQVAEKSPDSRRGSGTNTATQNGAEAPQGLTHGVPPVPAAAGQLVLQFEPNATIDPATIQGYVVGEEGSLVLKKADTGEHYIDGVPPGEHDIIITAGALALPGAALVGTQEFSPTNGVRLNDVKLTEGSRVSIAGVELPPLGSLLGKVTLTGQTDHAGIDVYLPGTSFAAKSAADGSFVMSGVPQGKHSIYFEKAGYHRGQVEHFEAVASIASTTPDIVLALSTGAKGFLTLAGGAAVVSEMDVEVVTGAGGGAVLMVISESETFAGAAWQPLVTTSRHTFSAAGARRLCVKFADGNGLESNPVCDDLTIDVVGPQVSNVALGDGSGYAPTSNLSVIITAADASAITEMRVGEADSIESAGWVAYASATNVTLSDGAGEKEIAVQLRDQWGQESQVWKGAVQYAPSNPGVQVSVTTGQYAMGGASMGGVKLAISLPEGAAPAKTLRISESATFASGNLTVDLEANPEYLEEDVEFGFDITGTQGARNVYVEITDFYDRVAVASATVLLDTILPTRPEFSVASHRTAGVSETIALGTQSTDANLKGYEVKGGQYANWTEASAPFTFQYASTDAFYDLSVRARDMAGNVSAVSTIRVYRGQKTRLLGNTNGYLAPYAASRQEESVILLAAFSPYMLSGNSGVFEDRRAITIEAGATVEVEPGTDLRLFGSFVAENVTITSSASSPAAGDWGLSINTSYGNVRRVSITGSTVEYFGLLQVQNAAAGVTLRESTFRNYDEGVTLALYDTGADIYKARFACQTGGLDGIDPDGTGEVNTYGLRISAPFDVSLVSRIDRSVVEGCVVGIEINRNAVVNISNSNLHDNFANIRVWHSNTEHHSWRNNFWGLDGSSTQPVNDGDTWLLGIETVSATNPATDPYIGSFLWSPHRTTAVSDAGP